MTQPFLSSEEQKELWKQGQVDCMVAYSCDNIKRKLDTHLQQKDCHFPMDASASQVLISDTQYLGLGSEKSVTVVRDCH